MVRVLANKLLVEIVDFTEDNITRLSRSDRRKLNQIRKHTNKVYSDLVGLILEGIVQDQVESIEIDEDTQ